MSRSVMLQRMPTRCAASQPCRSLNRSQTLSIRGGSKFASSQATGRSSFRSRRALPLPLGPRWSSSLARETIIPRDDSPAGFGVGAFTGAPLNPTSGLAQNESGSLDQIAASLTSSIPAVSLRWLRDNCQCDECVHPITKQRQLDTFSLPQHVEAVRAHTVDGSNGASSIEVQWQDGHMSSYRADWLSHVQDLDAGSATRQATVQPKWWAAGSIHKSPPTITYDAITSTPTGLAEWTRKIREYGFCFTTDVPLIPSATESLLTRLGPIRNTHYGGFYDFTSDLSSKDTAYTNLALAPHNDTTYFSEPVGIQAFHILEHSGGTGGESQLVDGFRAAEILRLRHPSAFETLRSVKLWAHASGNDGVSIQPARPFAVLETDPRSGAMWCVRWNNDDRAAFAVDKTDNFSRVVDAWYDAAKLWNEIVTSRDEEVFYEIKLIPGTLLVFDNWRVLHGRSAFTGKRRVAGGYVNRDDFISTFKMANLGREEVLRSGVY